MSTSDRSRSQQVAVVIPARYASTRLPGKPLCTAAGRPLIELVYRRVQTARSVSRILVATDDARIAEVVESFGGTARMTRADHPTGSDRMGELLPELTEDIIINVQGDEPEIDPALLDALANRLSCEPDLAVATAAAPFPPELSVQDPNRVKLVVDRRGRALYFSRAPIPAVRHPEGSAPETAQALLHIGVYAYRREALVAFLALEQGPLERLEGLEQLRLLENGMPVGVVRVPQGHSGIDTPADLAALERRLKDLGQGIEG